MTLRLRHLFLVPPDAPFRLGGLFYEFSQQIIANGYALPKHIPYYSLDGLPFAYPPLGFYLQALMIDLFSPPLFWTVNWLPPLLATLALPAYYRLLRRISQNEIFTLSALLAFAFMPAAFVNQIEAAGLAEACGTLTLIGYAYFLLDVNTRRINILWAGILLAATISASPGSAIAAVVFSLLFVTKKLIAASRRKRKPLFIRFALVGGIGLLASAPYWVNTVRWHGIAIFIAPMLGQFNHPQSGSFLAAFLRNLFAFNYAGGDYALIWNVLILAGLLYIFFQAEYCLPLLFFSIALIPRESNWLIALITPLFVAKSVTELILPLLKKRLRQPAPKRHLLFFATLGAIAFFSININALTAVNALIADESWQISPAEVRAFTALQKELPPQAKVVVLGNEAWREWAPQLLQHEVINEIYGLEWQPGEFVQVISLNATLQKQGLSQTSLQQLQAYSGMSSFYILRPSDSVLPLTAENASLLFLAENDMLRLEKLRIEEK